MYMMLNKLCENCYLIGDIYMVIQIMWYLLFNQRYIRFSYYYFINVVIIQ